MDVVQAVSGYISKMVTVGDAVAGTTSAKMKILLLDSETVRALHFRAVADADVPEDIYSLRRHDPICPP